MNARRASLARIADEGGFALPMSLLLVLAAFAIVSVAILASIQAQSGTTRDEQSKGAIQAAEAGFSDALLRYNTYSSTTQALTPAAPCISQSGVPSAIQGNGWCPQVQVAAGGGTATYWVRFPSAPNASTLEVFSVGSTVDSVTRRVDATALSAAGAGIFSDAAVKAQTGLVLDSNAVIQAGSQSGGDITVASNAKQCGPARVGLGRHLNGPGPYYTNTACTPPSADPASAPQAALTLPPVNQGNAPTSNNDINITNAKATPPGAPADLISGNPGNVGWTGAGTGPGQRQLSIASNTNLTLTGTKYSLCSLDLGSNSAIYIAAGLNATIFFDSPEHCGLTPDRSGTYTQFTVGSNARISYTLGAPASVALLFVGSTATPPARTAFLMNSNTDNACVQNFVVYAPLTDITLDSNSHFCGALAGSTVHLNSNATVQTDAAASSYQLPNTPPHYQMSRLVECSAAGSSPQATGC